MTVRVNIKLKASLADKKLMAERQIDYQTLEIQRTRELEQELEDKLLERKKALGRAHNLRHVILHSVVSGRFEMATKDLDVYVDMQSDFPNFKRRANRYIRHCHDIIQAIDAKKNFQGLATLPLSKQQELLESVIDHFEELKHYLKKIEIIEKDVKLDDMRSTVWILRATCYSVAAILVVTFLKEYFSGLHSSTGIFFDDLATKILSWLANFF